MRIKFHIIILAVSLALAVVAQAEDSSAPNFEASVRPVLAKRCYDCHGNGKRKGGLSLESEKDALLGGDSLHPAYAAGDSASSAMIKRVIETDPAKRMPPRGEPLAAGDVAALRAWIDAGAKWGAGAAVPAKPIAGDFWSFKKPVQAPLPTVKDSSWVKTPIDNFVLARIEAAGLKPSPEADRYTLARRLYLDLTGLPPTPKQLDAYVKDTRPDAYERLVEDLLASPHYGERMAVMWLDAAHYADTNGFEKDRPRTIWPYRDWVINALNKNKPYDRFVIEQYAGDMLPDATQDQRIATGFLRNTMINEEGGVDQEEYRFEQIVDRVTTTGMVFLGLTLNCAQCHSHKFDPITQREYYEFFALLNNADEVEMPVVTDDVTKARDKAEGEIRAVEDSLASRYPIDPALRTYTALKPTQANAGSGSVLNTLDDGSVVAAGDAADNDTYTLMVDVPAGNYTGVRLEALTDKSLPKSGPGRTESGNFVLTEITAKLFDPSGKNPPKDLSFARASADVEQEGYAVSGAIDGKKETGWGVDAKPDGPNHDHAAAFMFDAPLKLENAASLSINLDQQFGKKHLLGKFKLSLISENLPNGEDKARADYLSKQFGAWKEDTSKKVVAWTMLKPEEATSIKHVTFNKEDDLSLLVSGDDPNTDTYTVTYRTDLQGITALRLEVLPDPSLPGGGPGRGIIMSPNEGDFLLSEFAVSSAPADASDKESPITLQNPTQDFAANGRDTAKSLDGKMDTGWSVMGGEGKPHAAVYEFATPVGSAGGTVLKLKIDQYYVHLHTIGRFRVSVTTAPQPVQASGVPADVEETLLAMKTGAVKPSADSDSKLMKYYLSVAPDLESEHKKIAEMRKAMPKYPKTLVLAERKDPRTTKIHHRGEFLSEREPVDPNVPSVLPPFPADAPHNRLTLARWLVSEDNPLTARTAVNRTWQLFFGRGIVASPDDFGVRGDIPTHPELLDWLAVEFVKRGWDMKDLARLIVTSATYRQDSRVTPELQEKDPTNEWLARGPRFRVDGEFVRDIALMASGQMYDKIGGPSVYPPLPEGMLDLVYASGNWQPSTAPDKYRRAMYTFWKRTMPYPTSMTYDCPARDVSVVKRVRSNTPLQALTQLNDPVFTEAAQAMALRVLHEFQGTRDDRIRYAFMLCTSRPPDDDEMNKLRGFFETQIARFAKGDLDSAALTAKTDGATPALGAWTALCRALLNLDETITRG